MCGGKSQDMIGIDGASGALTGKVIDITKKKKASYTFLCRKI